MPVNQLEDSSTSGRMSTIFFFKSLLECFLHFFRIDFSFQTGCEQVMINDSLSSVLEVKWLQLQSGFRTVDQVASQWVSISLCILKSRWLCSKDAINHIPRCRESDRLRWCHFCRCVIDPSGILACLPHNAPRRSTLSRDDGKLFSILIYQLETPTSSNAIKQVCRPTPVN